MPRSKNPEKYPSWYDTLLIGAYNATEPVYLPFPNKSEAMRVRQKIYAFIRAREHEEFHTGVSIPLRKTPKYHKVTLTVESFKAGWAIALRNINLPTAEAEAILAALDPTDYEAEAHKAQARAAMETEVSRSAEESSERAPAPYPTDNDDIASRLFGSTLQTFDNEENKDD